MFPAPLLRSVRWLSGGDAHHPPGAEISHREAGVHHAKGDSPPQSSYCLTAPLSARGDTWKQQRYSEAGDQKFLPSFEVSVFVLFWKGGRKQTKTTNKAHSPQEGHNTQGLLFSFPMY